MRKTLQRGVTMLLAMLMCIQLMAQNTITGKVTDAAGSPLPGATVKVRGSNVSTQTDSEGNFSISAPANAKLEVSFVGFATRTVDAGTATIALENDQARLSEVVVTGLSTGIKRSNLANSIATLGSKDLTGTTRPPTLDGAISGKVAGAQVMANSGAPGGGFSMRLRGFSSVIGSSEPLFVIDGVIINNDQFPTGAGTGAFNGATSANAGTQDQAPNRIADINPADIETVSILKGPSAAAIYGSRANAGVVVITTKRGRAGKTSINLSQDIGQASAINLLGSSNWDNAKIDEYGGAYGLTVAEAKAALAAAGGKTWDHEKNIFGNKGFISNTNLNVSGGTEQLRFYVSGSLQEEGGIMKNTGFNRKSIRTNVDYRFNKWLDMKISSSYINNYTSRGFTGNDNNGVSLLYSLAYIPNFLDIERRADGTYPTNSPTGQNPYEIVDRAENIERTNRFLNSGELNAWIFRKEKIGLRYTFKGGVDYLVSEPRSYVPEDVQYQARRANPGASRYATNKAFYQYVQNSLNFNATVGKDLDLNTSFNLLNDKQNREFSWIQGTGLLPGQRNPSTAQVRLTESQVQKEVVVAFDVAQDFNWGDKIIGRAGIRADKSTLSGLNFDKWYYFPRASLAVNLANFSFLEGNRIFSTIKPRVAYGETSGFPSFDAVYSQLGAVNYGGQLGSASPTTIGQAALEPERATELEFGVDLGLFNNRVVLEATAYDKKIKDFLFTYALAPATGVSSIKAFPVGDLQNKGIELSLNAKLLQRKNFSWNTNLQWWKNESEVTRLIIPPLFVPGSGFGAYGRKRLQQGMSPTAWWGNDASGALVSFKDYQPDFQMSWNNTFNFFNGFELSMLWHMSEGNHNSSLTRLLKDEGGTTVDWSTPGKSGDPVGVERQATVIDNFIFDASYIRMREASLYYTIPSRVVQNALRNYVSRVRLGVSAQNLITITDYFGYDPEVSNFVTSGVGGGGALVGGVDLGPFPAVKRIFFHVNVTF